MEHKMLPKFRSGKYCQYCDSLTEVTEMRYGDVQSCPKCTAYVSLDINTGEPKGVVANSELRRERRALHVVVDKLKRRKIMRSNVSAIKAQKALYGYMVKQLNLEFELNSIAQLSLDETIRIRSILNEI